MHEYCVVESQLLSPHVVVESHEVAVQHPSQVQSQLSYVPQQPSQLQSQAVRASQLLSPHVYVLSQPKLHALPLHATTAVLQL